MTKEEKQAFRENCAYGAYYTKSGEKVLFNRKYQPLADKTRWVEDIVKHEFYYNDGTDWVTRIIQSGLQKPLQK